MIPNYSCFPFVKGYSGSDLQALCEEAAMMPIRELGANILKIKANQVAHLDRRYANCLANKLLGILFAENKKYNYRWKRDKMLQIYAELMCGFTSIFSQHLFFWHYYYFFSNHLFFEVITVARILWLSTIFFLPILCYAHQHTFQSLRILFVIHKRLPFFFFGGN